MKILTIRTDKPEAEIGLFNDNVETDYIKWQAHKELSLTILTTIKTLLDKNNLDYKDIEGVIIYSGPGSFTGLRIGFSVGNSLSYGLKIPIVSTNESNWIKDGISRLKNKESDYVAVPYYGQEPHVTAPRK